MKFRDFKTAAFAETAFKAAGLDLEAAIAANDANVIKAALDAKTATKTEDPELSGVLTEALDENKKISAELATAKGSLVTAQADASKFTALSGALVTAGLPDDPAKFTAALDEKVSKSAAALVAKSGHAPIADEINAADGSKKREQKKESTATGRDRLAEDFDKQYRAMWQAERGRN